MNVRPFFASLVATALLAGLVAGVLALGYQIRIAQTPPASPTPPGPAVATASSSSADGSASPVAASAAPPRPGELVLPADGGRWPWPVGGPGLSAPALPVRLPPADASAVWGVAVSPASGLAVVALHDAPGRGNSGPLTDLIWCDLSDGRTNGQWEIPGRFGVFDLSGDGRRLLAQKADASGTDLGVLELFTRAGKDLDRRKWTPHTSGGVTRNVLTVNDGDGTGSGPENQAAVAWAGFVGPKHIVTVSVGGGLRVWDAATLKQTGEFTGVTGRPAVTPDGAKLAFLADRSVALLDPAAGLVLAAKVIGKPPAEPTLAWRPDGKMLACAGNGQVTFLDMATGKVWDVVMPELKFPPLKDRLTAPGRTPSFGWAGDRHLYCDGKLFEAGAPVPVWQYTGAKWSGVRGRQVWSVVRHPGDAKSQPSTLRADTLPDPTAKAAIARALANPGVFALKQGDAVRLDVSALPADKRADAREALEKRLKEVGYVVKADAASSLVASADTTGPERDVTYGKQTIFYTWRPARLRFVRNGATVWEAVQAREPPQVVYVGPSGTVEDTGFGNPDYDLFATRPLPAVVRGADSQDVFGSSEVTPTGLKTSFVAREAQASNGRSGD